ncbi:MAG: type restriction enzyme [Patescibacteria group bacterium]|nr:type restriction enzyme [Patescibacteria group bacterium]
MANHFRFTTQDYQTDAVNALVDCFAGQPRIDPLRIIAEREGSVELYAFANRKLQISDNDIYKNVKDVQNRGEIKPGKTYGGRQFSIEMETGTGKTFVYTKSIFELNKQYGWSKFIIMVPSVAIREGVYKSLSLTQEYFQQQYGKKLRYFIYDTKNKSNIANIKNFGNTANIEVIVMNYQAFATSSKDSRKIYNTDLDATGQVAPIDIIKRTNPIVIMDEPQRFGPKAEAALNEFNPLFITRYSATHLPDKLFNKIYKLDPIDAYNEKLVKKVKAKGVEVVGNTGTSGYVFLDRIDVLPKHNPTAIIEFDQKQATGIKRIVRRVGEGFDLYDNSNELQQYKGYKVAEINGITNTVRFLGLQDPVHVGQAIGDVGEEHVRRIQIRETIKSHLEKERELFGRGIKVLSLFFIDEVAKYREYGDGGEVRPGVYARIFEEEYDEAVKQIGLLDPEYQAYLEKFDASEIHEGYFSKDNKGRLVNSSEKRGEGGSDDVSAYDLIMKDKETLLDMNGTNRVRFIFSHSALREGWDNPNIFQICTLKHSQSEISKRQEIGRGLRIAVNKLGERMDQDILKDEFFDVNSLTVIASESYKDWVADLQREVVESLKDRSPALTTDVLVGRTLVNDAGDKLALDATVAMNLIFELRNKGYLDDEFKVTEQLIADVTDEKVQLSDTFEPFKIEILKLAKAAHDTNTFQIAEDGFAENISEKNYKPNENFAKKEFQELWNRIKVKTSYEVNFDSEELVQKSIQALDKQLHVRRVRVNVSEGEQADILSTDSLRDGEGFVRENTRTEESTSVLGSTTYDLVGEVAKSAHLTRKTTAKILTGVNADTFANYTVNPEEFIQQASRIIKEQKAATLINGITYHKTSHEYDDSIFTLGQLRGKKGSGDGDSILEVKKHVYDLLRYDSKNERKFAQDLEAGEVSVYAKLPTGFKIPTPVGDYNPDWAIVFDREDIKHIYFVAETKGSMSTLQLKKSEELKIDYARKHFKLLASENVTYDVVDSYETLLDIVK